MDQIKRTIQKENYMRDLIQITEWEHPNFIMNDTQYGRVRYHNWALLEQARVDSDQSRVSEIRKGADGKEALFVNDVGDRNGR